MNIEFMCELLANYSKELSEAETYREKGDVQLKHAKLILDKVKNCSIPDVVGRSEQLKAFLAWLEKEGGSPFIDKDALIDDWLKSL